MDTPLNRAVFGQSQVSKASGVGADLIQNWANRGLIRTASQNPGTGRARMYTGGDALRIALMGRLTDAGLSAVVAAEFTSALAGDIIGTDVVSQGDLAYRSGDDPHTTMRHWLIISQGPQGYEWTLGQSFHDTPPPETGRTKTEISSLERKLLQHDGRAMIVLHLEPLFDGVLTALEALEH
jgi:hypothetical protein